MYSRGGLRSYFTEPSAKKYLFYVACLAYVIGTSIIVLIEPFLTFPCTSKGNSGEFEFENSLYSYNLCDDVRHPKLLFFTRSECERGRHLLMAVFLGSLIGYERRQSDRPAGIRTMALVSLGSALFTVNSTYAFLNGPMSWDSSRVSAAIPSGVGFLGAGLIVKSSETDPETGERHHLVQGITTAAATWLSAAVGLACGGGLYFTASFSTALNLVLLRFGPRPASVESELSQSNLFATLAVPDLERGQATGDAGGGTNAGDGASKSSYGGVSTSPQERQPLTPVVPTGSIRSRGSTRNKPSLL